jgi:hypothetical protein
MKGDGEGARNQHLAKVGEAFDFPASVVITLPRGTTFGSSFGGTVTDTYRDGLTESTDCRNTSGTTVVCSFDFGNPVVNAGDQLSVVLTDVINRTATGSAKTTVSTSSDTVTATKSVTLTRAHAVANLSATPASTAASATTDWTIGFTTSSTGALPYPDSTVTVTFPTGTTLGSFQGGTVTDTTTGDPLSDDCSDAGGTTVVCTLNEGGSVNAGDGLSVDLTDVTLPTTTGSSTLLVSTSADTKAATAAFTVTPAQAVSNLSTNPASTAAGAKTDWTVGFNTSSTGVLPYSGSAVTVALPAGTTFGYFAGGTITDTTSGQTVSSDCSNTNGTTVVCTLNEGHAVDAGDALSVVLNDVSNPTTTGPATSTLSTSADTKTATKSITITAAQGPVCEQLSGRRSVTIKKCTPTSRAYEVAQGSSSALTFGGGKLTWSTSGKTTKVQDTVSSPGQGSCTSGSIERDVFGYVVGGTSTYTTSGDPVFVRMCQSGSGALSLVPGTSVTF